MADAAAGCDQGAAVTGKRSARMLLLVRTGTGHYWKTPGVSTSAGANERQEDKRIAWRCLGATNSGSGWFALCRANTLTVILYTLWV